MRTGELSVKPMGRGVAWLDLGTHDSLLAASHFVQTLEHRQGLKIACIEEVALAKGFITPAEFEALPEFSGPSDYARYLRRALKEHQTLGGTAAT